MNKYISTTRIQADDSSLVEKTPFNSVHVYSQNDDNFTGFKLFLIQEKKDTKTAMRGLNTVSIHIARLKTLSRAIPDLSVDGIRNHLLKNYTDGRKGRSLNLYIHTLQVYGRYKQTHIYKQLDFFPEEKINKAIMSDSEIETFLNLPPIRVTRYHWKSKGMISYSFDPKGWRRMTLFWKIVAYSGMRCGEVASLKKEQLDFGRQIFIANGKTGERFVPIAPILISELKEYISSIDSEFLFPQRKNQTIKKSDWSSDFRQRIKRLGIVRAGLSAHSLRHSFITRMLGEDVNLFKVQKIVGHSNIATTAKYTHLTTKDIVTAINKDPLSRRDLSKNEKILMRRKLLEDSGCVVVSVKELPTGNTIYEIVED